MIKHTKKITAVVCVVLIVVSSCITIFANSNKLIDDAYLFSQSEYEQLKSMIDDAIERTGWDMLIYTNYNDVDEYDMEDYCNDYYDENGYGLGDDKSGISLTIDMSSRQMYIITKGDTMYYFSDERIDSLLDDVQYSLSVGDYYEAAENFINETVEYYNLGEPEDGSFSNVEIAQKQEKPVLYALLHYGIFSLIFGIGVGFLVVYVIHRKYKNNGKEHTYDLNANSKLHLTNSVDTFLTKSVSVHTIQSSSSSGGSHSSGGGGSSHGGGGRSF